MDATGFDAWTRALLSRRRVLWTLLALGAAMGASPAAARTKTKQNKGGGTRFGCAKRVNICVLGTNEAPCPHAPPGADASCVVTNAGQPVCASRHSECADCANDADCATFGADARCIACPSCQAFGSTTLCLVPQPAASAGSRYGCTKQHDACADPTKSVPCPQAPAGADAICVQSNHGQPVCVVNPVECHACASDADCVSVLGDPAASCIQKCPACQKLGGSPTACVLPQSAVV